MARPRKQGMDYFPHDTDAASDEKVEALEATFGNDGYAFYFKTLERIYRTENARLDLSLPGALAVLAVKIKVSQERLEEMIDFACEWELFDAKLYKRKHILSSNGIQRRAEIITEAREQRRARYKKGKEDVEFVADETPDKLPAKPPTRRRLSYARKERKGKESKGKKGKGNDSIPESPQLHLDELEPEEPEEPKPPKPDRATTQQMFDTLREPLSDEDLGLIDEYIALLAAKNKSGEMTLPGQLNRMRELLEIRDGNGQTVGVGVDPWRYGMNAANKAGIPNPKYVRTASSSWQPKSYAGSQTSPQKGPTRVSESFVPVYRDDGSEVF